VGRPWRTIPRHGNISSELTPDRRRLSPSTRFRTGTTLLFWRWPYGPPPVVRRRAQVQKSLEPACQESIERAAR